MTDYTAAKFGKSGQDDQCHYCGLGGHGKKPDEEVRKEKCRAWDQECLKCKKKGHYARKCESKKGEVRKVGMKECSSTAESSDEEAAVGPVIGSVSGLGPFCQIFSRQTSDGEESNRMSQRTQATRGTGGGLANTQRDPSSVLQGGSRRSPPRLRQEKSSEVEAREVLQGQGKRSPSRSRQEKSSRVEAREVLQGQGKRSPPGSRQEKSSEVEAREVLQGQGKRSPPRLMQEKFSNVEAISDEEEPMFNVRKPYGWDRSNSEAESSESSDGEEAVVSLVQSSDSNESNSEVEVADGKEDDAEDLVIGSVNGAGQFCGISLGRPSAGKEKTFWRPWESGPGRTHETATTWERLHRHKKRC